MVFVVTFYFDIEVTLRRVGKGLEEVEEHFGGHIADFFPPEVGLPHQPGAPGKIDGHLRQCFVHWQQKAVTADAPFVAQGASVRFAQRQGGVFDGVVLVDVQITVDVNRQIGPLMFGNLVEHVVEETKAGMHVGTTGAVQV